jgi:hypothetical protein
MIKKNGVKINLVRTLRAALIKVNCDQGWLTNHVIRRCIEALPDATILCLGGCCSDPCACERHTEIQLERSKQLLREASPVRLGSVLE